MADRPMASASRVGRPRMRLRSAHRSTHIPVAVKPRAKSAQKTQVKGKGTGKGKSTKKKSKTVAVVSSDSEDLELDFPKYPPNQPQTLPEEQAQEPENPVDALAEGPGEPEEQQQPMEIPADEGADPPQEPNNPNPLLQHPPTPMANNQLNWSHFRAEFSGKPEEDMEAHLLRTNDWMTIHDFPEDQKVRRFCLLLKKLDYGMSP